MLNLRDLGGLPTNTRGVTRSGFLLRSATLQFALDSDVTHLNRRLRGGLVVDLRSREESLSEGGPALEGVRHSNIPMRNVDACAASTSMDLGNMYESMVREQTRAAIVVNRVAACLPEPCLIHCAAGKDRTGVIAALTLGIAGVQRESIVADYMRTNADLAALKLQLSARPRYRVHMDVLPPELYEVNPQALKNMIDVIDTEYGGFSQWARTAGVLEEAITRIRSTLVF